MLPSQPVVYLDSQDYSRFGDVLRGKGQPDAETAFLQLEQRMRDGDAIFAVSMPLLGELLQYHPDFRETTMKKAEAVERLCGTWALAFPTRLVAAEIARAAQSRGMLPKDAEISVVSSERYWYPNVADVFRTVPAKLQDTVDSEIRKMELSSRIMRRRAKKMAQKIDYGAAVAAGAPEIAETYGIPIETVTKLLIGLTRGTTTPEQASRLLFGAIAEPKKFVETYFEKVETDRSQLPDWMSGFGATMEGLLVQLLAKVGPLMDLEFARNIAEKSLAQWPEKFSREMLKVGAGDVPEFGINLSMLATLTSEEGFASHVPACEIVGKIATAYTQQVLGLSGSAAKIEGSFGGDLMHALYLPHVDLWRGDRRFSQVVKSAIPKYADRIVPTLKALPDKIDAWNLSEPRRS